MELTDVYDRIPGLEVRRLGDENQVVNTTAGHEKRSLFTLDETGSYVWDEIDGKKDVWQIICLLMEEFEMDEGSALAEVVEIIEEMEGIVIERVG